MPRTHLLKLAGLCSLWALLASPAWSDNLTDREGLAKAAFRSGGDPSTYTRLTGSDRCGGSP